ncbi:MAG: hypothetical protein KatS3mg131_2362 [Candidatus Tectimicrobiota bacterium]|nr:MAG: hypothetical protein KatS3mg131_2362 [Candidatus Tectomicrobia bacterium]
MAESAAEALALAAEEQDLVHSELQALLPGLSGPRRQAYEALAAGVARGQVPAAALPLLEQVVVLALRTGRARQVYRAEGERVLTGLLRRLPCGQALQRSLHEVNQALQTLRGQPLLGIQLGMRTLGHFTVTIETPAATLTLALQPQEVRVESLSVGSG